MTLGQMLRNAVNRHGDRSAFVTLGRDPTDWSYSEVYRRVRQFGEVLRNAGLERGDRVAIFSENCPEWALLDWACQCLGLVVVPVYATLPIDQAEYILRDSESKLLACGSQDLLDRAKCLAGIESVLLKGPGSLSERSEAITAYKVDIDKEIDAADPEDPCTFIYTSGTTGTPKGAVMPHRAFLHVCNEAPKLLRLDEQDSFLSFLPMSHVYERVAGQCLPVSLGASICFSKGLASLANEMKQFKPSIMFCVPRFLENLKDRIVDNVAKEPPLKQKLFSLMLSQGVRKARREFAPLYPLLDKLVGSKIRARTGGKLRFLVSGGAPLSPAVSEFYMAIGLHVLQGYGLTETSAGTCISLPGDNKYWTVGVPLGVEVEIAQDGEILVRGPALMLGYHNLPEETAKAIDEDGWFHTGDIGEFEGKNLKITDRKKDILVLANGKNIAPQKLENLLKTSPYIQEALVFGDGMEYCAALIVPNLEQLGSTAILPEGSKASESQVAKALIKKEVDRLNKTVAGFEMIKRHALLDQPFTIETGELTPTLKVKRKVVLAKYAAVAEGLK